MTIRELIEALEGLPDDQSDVLVPAGMDWLPARVVRLNRMKRSGAGKGGPGYVVFWRPAKRGERKDVQTFLLLKP